MTPYTILFLASSDIAVPLLEKLVKDERFDVSGLVCQPDRPSGRRMELRCPPTKDVAIRLGLKVFQPEDINDERFIEVIKSIHPDFIITFAYGQILKSEVLDLPKIAPLNVHASLLPKYRGASPIQSAIFNDDKETGITLIKMIKKMDAGPIAAIHKIHISDGVFADILHDELSELAANTIPDDLIAVSENPDIFIDQNDSEASFCKQISRDDGFIDFRLPAIDIMKKFRAYSSWPGIWTNYLGKRIKLIDISLGNTALAPGYVQCEKHSISIGSMDGSISVKQLQLEGKQTLHSDQFIIGHPDLCSSYLPS